MTDIIMLEKSGQLQNIYPCLPIYVYKECAYIIYMMFDIYVSKVYLVCMCVVPSNFVEHSLTSPCLLTPCL